MRFQQILLWTFISAVTVVAANADGDNKMHVNIDEVRVIEDLRPIDGITSSGQPDAEAFEIVAGVSSGTNKRHFFDFRQQPGERFIGLRAQALHHVDRHH